MKGTGTPQQGDEAQPGERIGAYKVLRRIARGGMATVYAVRDTRDGSERAMKVLLPLSEAEEAATRFRREFRALSRLQHRGVLRVFEFGMLHQRPWYTMELLEGRTLRDDVKTWGELEPRARFARARDLLRQITRALAYVHDRGLVHRDVTPANIMVLPDGQAKIMDFGVVKDMGPELTAVGELVGTVAWCSPEQILGDTIDARADLYSLGAVLYLMLTGDKPFVARTLQGYLEKHLHSTPKPPTEVQPLAPPDLSAIAMRLLSKSPADRYASATHLLNVLGDTEVEGSSDRWPPRTVGRIRTRAALQEALEDVANSKPGSVILLSGPAGLGKTRMLAEAANLARQAGLTVARGHCRPHDRPFGAFVGVYRELSHPGEPPVLGEVFGAGDDGTQRERYPVIAGLKQLVSNAAPVAVLIDDVELADAATVETLEYLVRNTLELARESIVFVLAQEAPSGFDTVVGRQLARTGLVDKHELGALTPLEIEELVLSLVSSEIAAARLSERLFEMSDGLPSHVSDMLRALVDEGVLVQGDDGRFALGLDSADITRSKLPMPASLREALNDRLQPLDKDALAVLRVIAAARREVDLDVVLDATECSEDDAMEALDDLVEAGLVTEKHLDDRERVALTEARLRDVLLDGLSAEARRGLHQRVGTALERFHRYNLGTIVEELAWQFEQAGLAPKAYAFLRLTAMRHLNRSLYDEAIGFLSRALRMEAIARPLMLLEDADTALAELHLARSQAWHHLGQWSDALDEARTAERVAGKTLDVRLQSRVLAELGSQLRDQGELAGAERALRDALDKAKAIGDTSLRPTPLYRLGAILWGKGDLDGAERCWQESLETAQQTGDARATGFGFNGLGILAFCRGQSAEARTQLEQSAKLFEELGMLAPLGIARINLSELYLSTGILRKALQLAERTVSQAKETRAPHGMALGLAYRAMALMEVGKDDEASENAREALRIVRELGTGEDEVTALATVIRVDIGRKAWSKALDGVEQVLPLLEQFDQEGLGPQIRTLQATALVHLDRHDEAIAVLEGMPPEERQWPHVWVRTAIYRGRALRLLGRIDEARSSLDEALAEAEQDGFRFFQLAARHELVQVTDGDDQSQHARVAVGLARSLAANLPRRDGQLFQAKGWGMVEGGG